MSWKRTWHPKITMDDWLANNSKLRREFETIENTCLSVRRDGRTACDSAEIRTNWSLSVNNDKLEKSVKEILSWKEEFEKLIITAENEMDLIKTEKSSTQRELDSLINNFTAVNDCLTMRSKRKQVDMCVDYVQHNLHQELNMLEKVKRNLIVSCEQADVQINRLFRSISELKENVRSKEESLRVEETTLNLGRSPQEFAGHERYDDGGCSSVYNIENDWPLQISYESWLENCRDVKRRVTTELNDSRKLRSEMCLPRNFAHNEIESRYEATDYSFRRRIYEYQNSLEELNWQQKRLTEERENLYEEINNLRECIRREDVALKVAQSQNTNRLQKSEFELRQDECTDGMREQIRNFGILEEDLLEKLMALKISYGEVQSQIAKIQTEMEDKKSDVTIDTRCLDVRKGLLI